MENERKVYTVVEVLEKFGKYHWIHYILVALPSLITTMFDINFLFVAGDLDYRCRVPECDTPESTHIFPSWWPNHTQDKCTKPVISPDFYQRNGTCSNSSFTEEVMQCTEWIYESNNTIVADLNLACQPWKINLVGTVHNIGMLFSMIVAGWMSDRFGRKPTMIFCATAGIIGHFKPFATSYYMYLVIEFIEALLNAGVYVAMSVMLIEFGGKSNRVFAGVLIAYVVYMGECLFAAIAMAVPYWKNLVRIIYTPPIFFLTYIFLIQESPRWQVLNGKTDQAKKTIKDIARTNKLHIDEQDLKEIDDVKLKLAFSIDSYEKRDGLKEIFTSKEILKRLVVASVCRFASGFIYYGLVVNSVLLPGNKYTNFLLSTIMSFPGELIAMYLMNRIGRKMPLMVGYLVCGAMCVASGYATANWLKVTCFCLGKMVIAACFTGVITYTMEFFPTSTRASLLSLGSVMSRLGAMLAPLTPMLLPISPVLPSACFTAIAILASALLTLTPETKDLPLLDTIAQVEALANAHAQKRRNKKIDKNFDAKMATNSCETAVTKI
ncbi:sugar transporter domain-containing protein [Phthorimaea operculella]|nr:sugar transporter domain-containing protein [Phthorimaea operculella]